MGVVDEKTPGKSKRRAPEKNKGRLGKATTYGTYQKVLKQCNLPCVTISACYASIFFMFHLSTYLHKFSDPQVCACHLCHVCP
jgi:hypothetical protein